MFSLYVMQKASPMNRKDRRRAAHHGNSGKATTNHRIGGRSPGASALLSAAERLHNTGRFSEAAELCKTVLAEDPQDALALLILGSAASELGEAKAALGFLQQAVALRPDDARAWVVLATHLLRSGDGEAALQACQTALRVAPRFAAAHVALGSIHAAARKYALAEAAFRCALALAPGLVDAEVNLGSALFYQGRLEDAVAAQRRALALQPNHIHAQKNLAASLRALGNYGEALAAYRQAVAAAPQFADAHRDEALLLLLLGQFEEGWAKYEWRLRASTRGAAPIEGPRWSGEHCAGGTILLQAEQGIGDTIQFLRYVPLVAQRCDRVILNLPPSLARLGGDALSAAVQRTSFAQPLPQFDCHCALLSLPRILATSLDNMPPSASYLRAPPGSSEGWRREFAGDGRMRVGVVWAGNPDHENDHNRSIAFAHLLPLFDDRQVRFYSLQVGERSADLQAVADAGVTDLSGRLGDFADTAGAIEAMHLVISVDTAVAHLAGALGKPVWLLLPYVPDWRWLLDRDDSPWYPTMRLFRQAQRGDWDEVVARVGLELGACANSLPSPLAGEGGADEVRDG
jgi:tetratricopeptide (TPR) repeat protein